MHHQASKHLEKIISEGRSFDIGITLSRGWNIWKQNAGAFIGFTLFLLITSMGLAVIPVIGQLVSALITPALSLGAAIYAYRCATNEERKFNNFFDGFIHFKEITIYTLIIFIGASIILIPFFLSVGFKYTSLFTDLTNAKIPELSTSFAIMFFILMAVFIYISVCISITVNIIGFFELKAMDALRYSFRIVKPKWFIFFAFTLVAGLIAASGVLALVVGVFITVSIAYPMLYAAFDELTAVEEYYASQNAVSDTDESYFLN